VSEHRIAVAVIVPPRALLLDIAGPLEVLRRANLEQRDVVFDVAYASASGPVASSVGLTLSGLDPLPESLPDDAMIVVPGNADRIAFGDDPGDAGVERDEAAIVAWLARSVRPSHKLVTICSGALLAARAGLLDGHDCTTHFSVCGELGALAPRPAPTSCCTSSRSSAAPRSRSRSQGTSWCISGAPAAIRSSRRGLKAATTSIRRCIARRMRSRPIPRAHGRSQRSRASRARARAISRDSSTSTPAWVCPNTSIACAYRSRAS
jgi:putative intracellular protease/amidase